MLGTTGHEAIRAIAHRVVTSEEAQIARPLRQDRGRPAQDLGPAMGQGPQEEHVTRSVRGGGATPGIPAGVVAGMEPVGLHPTSPQLGDAAAIDIDGQRPIGGVASPVFEPVRPGLLHSHADTLRRGPDQSPLARALVKGEVLVRCHDQIDGSRGAGGQAVPVELDISPTLGHGLGKRLGYFSHEHVAERAHVHAVVRGGHGAVTPRRRRRRPRTVAPMWPVGDSRGSRCRRRRAPRRPRWPSSNRIPVGRSACR